jgi:hypothetical protein
MSNSELTTAEPLTFEDAIAQTQTLLDGMEQGSISDGEVEAAIASLVSSENGARGFFVTYLSDPRPLADQPSDAVIQALQTSPDIVAELLVKNLAMSSAMAITHRRNQNEEMAQGSDQVRSRTSHLIQQLQIPLIAERAQKLHESAVTGEGEYQAFLKRWGYDAEQRDVIQDVMEAVFNPQP